MHKRFRLICECIVVLFLTHDSGDPHYASFSKHALEIFFGVIISAMTNFLPVRKSTRHSDLNARQVLATAQQIAIASYFDPSVDKPA